MKFPKIPIGVIIICIIFTIIGVLWGSHAAGLINLTPALADLPIVGDNFKAEGEKDTEISPLEEENNKLTVKILELEKKVADLEALDAQYNESIKNYQNQIFQLESEIKELKLKEEKTTKMVELYSQMKPKEIAPIFENLNDEVVLDLLIRLDANLAADILAELDPLRAAKLSNLFTDN